MKAIMKTIKPKICANIMNIFQTILLIKDKKEATAIQKLIDENGHAEIYVCCSKNKNIKLVYEPGGGYFYVDKRKVGTIADNNLNGKVLFKFCCYDVDLMKYLNGDVSYVIYISDLEIFDRPRELSEFNALQRAKATDCGYLKQCKNCGKRFNRCHLLKPLTKAPQSWCYVEVVE